MKKYLTLLLFLFFIGCETPTPKKTVYLQNVPKITEDANQTTSEVVESTCVDNLGYEPEFVKRKEKFYGHTRKGELLMLEGQFGPAKKEFVKALEYDPNNIDIIRMAAESAMNEPDFDLAIKLFKKAVFIDKYDYRSYGNLAFIYYVLEDYEESKEAFNKVLDIDPDNIMAAAQLAEIYYQQKNYQNCLRTIELFEQIYYRSDLYSMSPLIRVDVEKRRESLRVYKKIIERIFENKGNSQL